jgi:hypothetical protein
VKVTRVVFCVALAGSPAAASRAAAQQSSASSAAQRTQVIAASFSKSKHVVKERRGVRVEKYRDVRSTPAVRVNPAEYSGRYEVQDMGFVVDLRVDANGIVTGSGYEPMGGDQSVRKTFRLVDGKIDGALLTATQIYGDGSRQRFEGVFMNRTSTDSPGDKGVTVFGLGVTGRTVTMNGLTMDKFFYAKRD